MRRFPLIVSDEELLAFIDEWAALLEQQRYDAAFALTGHVTEMAWTPELIREMVETYGDANPGQRVTVHGLPTDIVQRKIVDRWPNSGKPTIGQIWYDLNIDGLASDLTATFDLYQMPENMLVLLDDIHVM